MFYTDAKLQYPVRVEKPNPLFAKMLQQAIGGVEGEIRVCMQYFFQAWGARGPKKYRDLLLQTATEEIGHIEMLATAVALNLEQAPVSFQEQGAKDKVVGAVMGGTSPADAIIAGMDQRQILSTGLAALPSDSNGVPFSMSHIYASGNLAADMYCNVAAEATGRVLATRLYHATDDPGMRDMLSFMIARDTMHQQQWLAVIEELGLTNHLPIPNSFPLEQENREFSYKFLATFKDPKPQPMARWTEGESLDGKGEFSLMQNAPLGEEPVLGPARPDTFGQIEQAMPSQKAA